MKKETRSVNKEQLLYEYIIEHSSDITEKWFSLRFELKGEFYSSDQLSAEMKKLLAEQHTLTNKTIASSFLEDQNVFEEHVSEWAVTVAKNRVEQDAKIHEVVEAISNSRVTFWDAVIQFSKEQENVVTNEDIHRWNRIVNQAFDKLITEFCKQYQKFMLLRLTSQQELIGELGCPVISIAEEIGILPLIGSIDTRRAHVMLESVPAKCIKQQITSLVIDLSGVPIVDTMVARQLFNLSQTLFLLGVKAVFSGIRPDVAQTSIQLGLDFDDYETYGTLKQALARMGVQCIIEENIQP
jgi:rsbT co-antagonist protein RsbR|nr:STAS domain-containing protein [Bacillus atrophaeus]